MTTIKKEELLSQKTTQILLINGNYTAFAYSVSAIDPNDMRVRIIEENQTMLLSPHSALVLLEWLQAQEEHLKLLRDGKILLKKKSQNAKKPKKNVIQKQTDNL